MMFRLAIGLLKDAARGNGRNLQMPGDPHYQPLDLRPYVGYDQRAGWRIIVAWFWMLALAKHGEIPPAVAKHLQPGLLKKLLLSITETKVTALERSKTGHDILALLELMRDILPKALHRYLHLAATSYDVICTAYALQTRLVFFDVVLPKAKEVDELWRTHIAAAQATLQMGRTHLQYALPVTVGCWLSVLHNRFIARVRKTAQAALEIPGKFSGAVGTSAALRALVPRGDPEATLLSMLALPSANPCTQITQPEGLESFYHELMLLSAALANLGDDIRHLQASDIAEVITASSTSSTMSHKTSNPVGAEQMDGMHISVRCEFYKAVETLNSTLQRTLVNSSVMRGFSAMLVFTYQQLLTAHRVLKSFSINEARCLENFGRAGNVVTAELLHLSLQQRGFMQAHAFVNQQIVPVALSSGKNIAEVMDEEVKKRENRKLRAVWKDVPAHIRHLIANPELYVGDAVHIARGEAGNAL